VGVNVEVDWILIPHPPSEFPLPVEGRRLRGEGTFLHWEAVDPVGKGLGLFSVLGSDPNLLPLLREYVFHSFFFLQLFPSFLELALEHVDHFFPPFETHSGVSHNHCALVEEAIGNSFAIIHLSFFFV